MRLLNERRAAAAVAGLSDASAITALISLRFSSDGLGAKVTSADDASAHESD